MKLDNYTAHGWRLVRGLPRVAAHEAGHAIVACHYGAVFTGPIIWYPETDTGFADQVDTGALTLEQQDYATMAGEAAEILAEASALTAGAMRYAIHGRRIIIATGGRRGDDTVTIERIDAATEAAMQVLAPRWRAVIALVAAFHPQFGDDTSCLVVEPHEIAAIFVE